LHQLPTVGDNPARPHSRCSGVFTCQCLGMGLHLFNQCPGYYTVKVCSLSESSSVVVESGIRCPCMINTCHATALGILYPVYRLAALAGLQPSLLQYRAWVLVSLEIQYHPAPSYPAAAASRRHKFSAIIFRSTRFPLSNGLLGSLANLAYAPAATAFDDAAAPRLPRKSLHYRTWYQIRDTRTAATAPPHGLCDSCPTMLHMSIRIEVSARAQARCLQYNREYGVLNRKQSGKTLN